MFIAKASVTRQQVLVIVDIYSKAERSTVASASRFFEELEPALTWAKAQRADTPSSRTEVFVSAPLHEPSGSGYFVYLEDADLAKM